LKTLVETFEVSAKVPHMDKRKILTALPQISQEEVKALVYYFSQFFILPSAMRSLSECAKTFCVDSKALFKKYLRLCRTYGVRPEIKKSPYNFKFYNYCTFCHRRFPKTALRCDLCKRVLRQTPKYSAAKEALKREQMQ